MLGNKGVNDEKSRDESPVAAPPLKQHGNAANIVLLVRIHFRLQRVRPKPIFLYRKTIIIPNNSSILVKLE